VAREYYHISVGSSTQHHRSHICSEPSLLHKLPTSTNNTPTLPLPSFPFSSYLYLSFLVLRLLLFPPKLSSSFSSSTVFPSPHPQPFPLASACLPRLLLPAGTPDRPETSGLPEGKPERDSPEISPVLRITLLFGSSPACNLKLPHVKTPLVIFPASGHRSETIVDVPDPNPARLVVQLLIVSCPRIIEKLPRRGRSDIPRASNTTTLSPSPRIETLTRKPVLLLTHLRRPRSPL
jgi:hypothetical protein